MSNFVYVHNLRTSWRSRFVVLMLAVIPVRLLFQAAGKRDAPTMFAAPATRRPNCSRSLPLSSQLTFANLSHVIFLAFRGNNAHILPPMYMETSTMRTVGSNTNVRIRSAVPAREERGGP